MDNSFFAVDKLVEFGLSMAVAQQMIQSMNQSLDHMKVAGPSSIQNSTNQEIYYVIIDENQAGPFTEQQMIGLINDKRVTKSSYVWKPGLSNWQLAEKMPEILKLVVLSPPPFNK